MNLGSSSMWLRLLTISIYLFFQACVSCISVNNDFFGVKKECGSYAAVSHFTTLLYGDGRDGRSDLAVPLSHLGVTDNGGTASLHRSHTDLGIKTLFCGAVLISDRFFLTVAHCLRYRFEWNISISLGRDNVDENPFPGPDTYKIKESFIHPNYTLSTRGYYDIAIIKSNRQVQYSPKIWPFCLPYKNHELRDLMPTNIAGWGRLGGTSKLLSPMIQTAAVKLVENSRCLDLFHNYTPAIYDEMKRIYPLGFTNHILCAGAKGVDSCKGDSGGPLFHKVSDDRNIGFQIVIGLVSKGIAACPLLPIFPGIYTNVVNHIEWINDVIL